MSEQEQASENQKKTRKQRTPKVVAPTVYSLPSDVRVKSLSLSPSGEALVTIESVPTDGSTPQTFVVLAPPNVEMLRLGSACKLTLLPVASVALGDPQH